mmetsp:Transcript_1628/g.2188  ORF Transcript_1628/g.2188 Transcript_1628/m.2188 type:complete len:272 (+) Transcript_1628:237-1052(+)
MFSFFKGKNVDERVPIISETPTSPSLVPSAPPPAGAPPLAPPTPQGSEKSGGPLSQFQKSYQQQYRVTSANNVSRAGSGLGGNPHINPNTGGTNSAEGSGTALAEVMFTMRLINLLACTGAITVEILFLLGRLIFHPARAVLSAYLCFFASLLCCFELHTPWITQIIEEQFGMLQHPISRSFFLFLMVGLCWGQGTGILELALGCVFLFNGFYTIYTFIRYPEYRRMHDEMPQRDLMAMAREKATEYAWANPEQANKVVGETSSFIHHLTV